MKKELLFCVPFFLYFSAEDIASRRVNNRGILIAYAGILLIRTAEGRLAELSADMAAVLPVLAAALMLCRRRLLGGADGKLLVLLAMAAERRGFFSILAVTAFSAAAEAIGIWCIRGRKPETLPLVPHMTLALILECLREYAGI